MATEISPRHRERGPSKIQEVELVYHSKIYCFALGFFAVLATVLILPRCACNETVKRWWTIATTGVERKIVYRSLPKPSDRQVRFGEARARHFDKDEPPKNVGDIPSFQFVG
jgi:hypothetical protein